MQFGCKERFFCVLASILILISCGGGGDGSSFVPASGTGSSLSGVASKGRISDGTVEVYAIAANGQKGGLLGSTTTDSDGYYNLLIDHQGPIMVEVTGGTYIDEATGQSIALTETMRAALPEATGSINVAVTPLTEVAVRIAESSGSMDSTKIKDANDLMSQLLGDDIVTTFPTDCNDPTDFSAADASEKNYALLLAAISQMSESSGMDIPAILDALEEDLADMEMDQTCGDLLTGIDDFLASEDNKTGVQEATDLVTRIEDIADNGLAPTYRIGDGYFQYRTTENSANNNFRAYFSVSKSGMPLNSADDIDTVTLRDPDNTEISASNTGFWNGKYYSYNCRTTPCSESGPFAETGLYGTLDPLSPGVYQIEVQLVDGQTITSEMYYPGQLALPVVDSSSMQAQWSNGDLVLSWTNPTDEPNWQEVDQVRVVLFDVDYNDKVFVTLNTTAETVTLPAELLNKAAAIGTSGISSWQVQTRAYDQYNMNYARGNSNTKALAYALGYSFIQYRTFEDTNTNHYRTWMEVRTDGGLAADGDFVNYRLVDSSGNQVTPANTPSVWTSPFPYLVYNCMATPCSLADSTYQESGYMAKYDDLPADIYGLKADTNEGTLTTQVSYPGKLELPVIAGSSMQSQWSAEGNLILTWTNPTGETNWSKVDQLRFILMNTDGFDLLAVKINPNADTVTIPSDVIEDAQALGGAVTGVTLQTRAYDKNGINISRGISWYTLP